MSTKPLAQSEANQLSYKLNYNWTDKIVNSNDTICKILKCSLVGITLIALVETVIEVIRLSLKFLANNYIFQKQAEPISSSKDVKLEDNSDKKGWRKTKIALACLLVAGALVWGGSFVALLANQYSKSSKVAQEILLDPSLKPNCPQTQGVNPAEDFVRSFEEKQQCPSIQAIIEDQQKNCYWGLTAENMPRLFGEDRDLTLETSRFDFYHDVIQKNIPKLASAHPANPGVSKAKELPKEVAMDICALRRDGRDYTRSRGYEEVQKLLEKHEPRTKPCDFYWGKSGKNPEALLASAMRSNSFYDNRRFIQLMDKGMSYNKGMTIWALDKIMSAQKRFW